MRNNRVYRWSEQLFIGCLLSIICVTPAFSLSWINRDSYRVGNEAIGADYFLSAHNANAISYWGIQFNTSPNPSVALSQMTFGWGGGYRRFVTPYMQAGVYCFADSLADSEVDAAFSNINIGFEATYYRWLGGINVYLPNDARSNLTTFYMEDNPRFGIDLKLGHLLFKQYTVKGGFYYFSHEKDKATLGGSMHFSYPVTRRSTVDIKWICDTSLQNKWVISWQFNRSSPHNQTNTALWRPIDRPVSPLLLKRMQQRINQSMDAVLSEKDTFTFTFQEEKLNQDKINEIISKGYKAIEFKEACEIADSYLDIRNLSLYGIPKQGRGYNASKVYDLPVLKGQTLAMGNSKIKYLDIRLNPISHIDKRTIGLIIDKDADVSIESSKLHVESYLLQGSKQFIGMKIKKRATFSLRGNERISIKNNSLVSKAEIYLMDIEKTANIKGSNNFTFSLASLSTDDRLVFCSRFTPSIFKDRLFIADPCIKQSLTPYPYISDEQQEERKRAIAKTAYLKGREVTVLEHDIFSQIDGLEQALRSYSNEIVRYNNPPPEQLRTQYKDIQTLLTQEGKELPEVIKSLEKSVNSAYKEVYDACIQGAKLHADLKEAVPSSLEAFKQKDINWFYFMVFNLNRMNIEVSTKNIEIIAQYLRAQANKEWVEKTKEDLSKAYKGWEKFLEQEKTN